MDLILTVDIEEWYHANLLKIPKSEWRNKESRVVSHTEVLLDLFDQYEVKATFFVLGDVAKHHPDLIKMIGRRGHELASHGMNHELIDQLTDQAFREDVRTSKALIEDLTGQPVHFYRAPSWSLTPKFPERFLILEDEGYLGDSSVQPFKTPLSGSIRTPCEPFHPVINGKKLKLLEVPPTVVRIGPLRVPFAGGFYLRFLPLSLIRLGLKMVAWRHVPRMIYVHPWEVDRDMPKVNVNFFSHFVHYHNISTTELKMAKLLERFSVQPIRSLLEMKNLPSLSFDGEKRA